MPPPPSSSPPDSALSYGTNSAKDVLTSRNAMLALALIVIGLVFHALTVSRGATNPFLSARSISTVFTQASVIGVLACGMTFIIILTHIDLSVGSALAFLGGLAAWMMGRSAADLPEALVGSVPTGLGWPAGATILAVTGIGMILWGLKALIQNRTGMPAFIITLGGMMGYRGLALLIVKRERPVPTGNLVDQIGTGFIPLTLGWVVFGGVVIVGLYQVLQARRHRDSAWYLAWIPAGLLASVILFLQVPHEGVLASSRGIAYLTALWAASTIIMAFVANYSVFGRHVYATGGNREAARLSGVPVQRVNLIAFVIMGALTALASLMYLGQQGTAESSAGQLAELDAIAACVIGGISLQGGRGGISGAALGALIMQALTSGLYQCNVESGYQFMIKAAVLVVVVAVDHLLRRTES
jgi:ABC-type xylose transport system permease subunit